MIGHDAMTIDQNPYRLIVVTICALALIAGFWLYERRAAKKNQNA